MNGLQLIDGALVIPIIREWLTDEDNRLEQLPPGPNRRARALLTGEQDTIREDALDRLLVAIGRPELYVELVPLVKNGRGGYTWTNPHPSRKLTEEQVHAAYLLHTDGGLSLRELGRQLYERLGYASSKSCAVALSDAFKRDALKARDRVEATRLVSTTHGHGARADKAAYKRWRRSTIGPWPSDRKVTA